RGFDRRIDVAQHHAGAGNHGLTRVRDSSLDAPAVLLGGERRNEEQHQQQLACHGTSWKKKIVAQRRQGRREEPLVCLTFPAPRHQSSGSVQHSVLPQSGLNATLSWGPREGKGGGRGTTAGRREGEGVTAGRLEACSPCAEGQLESDLGEQRALEGAGGAEFGA